MNLMGYGAYSNSFSFIPRSVPAKPPTAPISLEPATNRNTIFLAYEKLWDDGGAPILSYNIYMDDGIDGAFIGPLANGQNQLTWNTGMQSMLTGRVYRFTYSATNVHGEGPKSDEVPVLLADEPGKPSLLTRINMNSLIAGDIRVSWALPSDEGGTPVTGYHLYLNGVLYYDASLISTLNIYTLTGLSVGKTYKIGIAALND